MARRLASFVLLLMLATPGAALARSGEAESKLDPALQARSAQPRGFSRVIIHTVRGGSAAAAIKASGGTTGRRLAGSGGVVAVVPDSALDRLAAHSDIRAVALDRRVHGAMERTAAAIGASWVREELGLDGAGVGVAIIDSGVANWHDDLGSERVVHFADFVTHLPTPYDDYGHGTHVAGIIAGNGFDSDGARRGVAPGASLIVLKVLDGDGEGFISNVIAAIDYAIEHRARFNIRVLNLSVASGVYESYTVDPLTLAAKRAVEAGIVVVTAAGNLGRNERGQTQHGGITAPGNAPWVLTVGATNHQRTAARSDDVVAPFSSRGPTSIDRAMKPDVVAPGVGIESLASAGSSIYNANAGARLAGTVDTASLPYMSMTGTSMSAPVVAGTVALMLQANPALTPNLVKAILQYTAEHRARFEPAAQGAGFLNARGAVQLATVLADGESLTQHADDPSPWSRHIIWGNLRVRGGSLAASANAWRPDVMWGATATAEGDHIIWGTKASGDSPWKSGAEVEPVTVAAYVDLAVWDPSAEMQGITWNPAAAAPGSPARAVAAIEPARRPSPRTLADITDPRGY